MRGYMIVFLQMLEEYVKGLGCNYPSNSEFNSPLLIQSELQIAEPIYRTATYHFLKVLHNNTTRLFGKCFDHKRHHQLR